MATYDLRFPAAGVERRSGFGLSGKRDAHPTPWAVNVRPEDPLAQRLRGGSRPGMAAFTGTVPEWPTGRLLTEAGDYIVTEAGDYIALEITGLSVLNDEVYECIVAYGLGNLTDSLSASVGTTPSSCTIGVRYRDRFVLAGADAMIWMSRQGDWTDWDYGGESQDEGRAVVLQLGEAGEWGETVTALIPHEDAVLLAATEYTLWIASGDPAAKGTLRNVSREVGIISDTAWVKANNTVFFLSRQGLFSVQVDGSKLTDLSGGKLPEELEDIDLDEVDVVMGWNPKENGIYIFLVGGDYHWYYDLTFGGFWPFTVPADMDPERVFLVNDEMIVWDGEDGYWTPDNEAEDDDGDAIVSHVLIGPLRPGSPSEQGMLTALHAAVETSTGGSVDWYVLTGDSAEEASELGKTAIEAYIAGNTTTAEGYAAESGTWSSGRSYWSHPRVRSMWMVLWLRSDNSWAMENVVAEMKKFGNWR